MADPNAALNLHDLLAQESTRFLGTAYQLVLGRPVDPEGFKHYDERIRAGLPRLQVLAELRTSPEGMQRDASIPGLAVALAGLRPVQVAKKLSFAELMRMEDEGFVEQAHFAVLGCVPDANTRDFQLARLRAGHHKLELLSDLMDDRPTSRMPTMPGLVEALLSLKQPLFPLAADARELLALEDAAFVECAYRTLLRRNADPRGLDHYLRRLRCGGAKLGVIASLQSSGEARAARVKLPGLRWLVLAYLLTRVPVFGVLVRALDLGESEGAMQRALRMLNNQLARQSREDAQRRVRAEQLAREVDRLVRRPPVD